jgi:hypothetical protein
MRSGLRVAAAILVLLMVSATLMAATAAKKAVVVPQGTQVVLVFDQAVKSETAKAGDRVKLHVRDNVSLGTHLILRKGTPVTGTIATVKKRRIYGINARIRIALDPVRSVQGTLITIEPRTKSTGGKKTGQAAAATAGGAIIAGPIGLVGGAFIHGKPVHIKVGDLLDTQVAKDTAVMVASKPMSRRK